MREKTLLLVEDNPDDEQLTLRALRKNNIKNEVVVAHDGEQALEYLLGSNGSVPKLKHLPEVVLLDLNLPKITGLEVLRTLRSDDRTRLLPVVILTTSNEEQDRFQGYDLGANSFVRKPVEFDRFMEAVRQLGMYWLLVNEPVPQPRKGS